MLIDIVQHYSFFFNFKIPNCSCYRRYLGISALSTTQLQDDACAKVPGLVVEQVQACRDNPESLMCISDGARHGIQECQYQFRNERWNCTTSSNYTVFGDVLRKGGFKTKRGNCCVNINIILYTPYMECCNNLVKVI